MKHPASLKSILPALCLLLGTFVPAAQTAPIGAAPVAANPGFHPPGGIFTNALSVTLTSAAPSAVIRFTTNGSEPTTNSPVFTSAIPISRSTRLRARAFQEGCQPSEIVAAPYTLLGPEVRDFNSNLPLLVINTYGGSISRGWRNPACLTVIPTSGGRASLCGAIEFQGRIGIESRGSSSAQFPKKSLRMELDDETTGANQDFPLLGLPADSDWVLYAPYTDKSLMRDVLAYDLWEEMGHYSVRRRFVEVFCDEDGGTLSTEDYAGVYVLLEKIKRGKHRVNIAKLDASDTNEPAISGGYILKRDRIDDNDNSFTTSQGIELGIEYPKGDRLAPAQRRWLSRWMDEFEGVLMGTNYADPVNGYARYLDVPAAIDHFWIIEMPNTIDGYIFSTYMHKNRGGKLVFSPVWDRNLSFGNANYLNGDSPTGWLWEQVSGRELCQWFQRLFDDPEFSQKQIDRWGELRRDLFATSNLLSRVDGYAALLNEAQARDFARWPRLGEYVWPNASDDWPNTTYAGTVQYLKTFITQRLKWIDRQFVPAPIFSQQGGPIPAGFQLTLDGPTNKTRFYYTLDGGDPRRPGGAIHPAAREYTGPIALGGKARVFARARRNDEWSPPAAAEFQTKKP